MVYEVKIKHKPPDFRVLRKADISYGAYAVRLDYGVIDLKYLILAQPDL
jgi:hypothetical protein